MEEYKKKRQDFKGKAHRDEGEDELPSDMIEGRNAVTEALRSGRTIDRVFIAEGDTDKALGRLAAMAKEAGAIVKTADRRKLDAMSQPGAHQGIIAYAAAHDYSTVEEILAANELAEEAAAAVGELLLIPNRH